MLRVDFFIALKCHQMSEWSFWIPLKQKKVEPNLTVLPLCHDRVAQGQSPEELPAGWTLVSSELLHKALGRHVQASARERVPPQIHGLHETWKVSLNSATMKDASSV